MVEAERLTMGHIVKIWVGDKSGMDYGGGRKRWWETDSECILQVEVTEIAEIGREVGEKDENQKDSKILSPSNRKDGVASN